nr:venom polypeptide precursor [Doratifera vulnerans]
MNYYKWRWAILFVIYSVFEQMREVKSYNHFPIPFTLQQSNDTDDLLD